MSNPFANRVAAERRVLAVINERLNSRKQLTGLSRAAIDVWAREINRNREDGLVRRLMILGGLCRALSDRSHETFHPVAPEVANQIEAEMALLKKDARALSREG